MTENFINKSKKIHENKSKYGYNYSKVVCTTPTKRVTYNL